MQVISPLDRAGRNVRLLELEVGVEVKHGGRCSRERSQDEGHGGRRASRLSRVLEALEIFIRRAKIPVLGALGERDHAGDGTGQKQGGGHPDSAPEVERRELPLF